MHKGVDVNLPSFDVAIFSRILQPKEGTLPVTAAQAWLKMTFPVADRERMKELSAKNQAGQLTSSERAEMDAFCRVARLLDIIHSKARRSLRQRNAESPEGGPEPTLQDVRAALSKLPDKLTNDFISERNER